jgi:hypothetical protein
MTLTMVAGYAGVLAWVYLAMVLTCGYGPAPVRTRIRAVLSDRRNV